MDVSIKCTLRAPSSSLVQNVVRSISRENNIEPTLKWGRGEPRPREADGRFFAFTTVLSPKMKIKESKNKKHRTVGQNSP
jgi:hypothetical protein